MLCLVPLGSTLPASPRPSSVCSYPPNLASTSISVHNSCFPPFSVFSPGILLYLSLCLSILKHLGKLANSKKKKQKKPTTDFCLYSTYYVPERSQDLLLSFPSSQQPCDREDTLCSSNPLSSFSWNYMSQHPLLPGQVTGLSSRPWSVGRSNIRHIHVCPLKISHTVFYTHLLTLFPCGLLKQKIQ